MIGARRVLAAMALSAALAGCAGSLPEGGVTLPGGGHIETPASPLECVTYARDRSGIAIYGDAATWWSQAANRYARQTRPARGSVLVLSHYAGDGRAHLAVVRRIVSPRVILVDHANWLNGGAIYLGDPVADISAANDWSRVRVFNLRTGTWGIRDYPVQGFIGPSPAGTRVAQSATASISQ